MKRKRIGIIVSGILVCCLGVGFYLWNQKQPPGEVVIDAKVDGYDSLEEIEDKVSIIVKAKKVSEKLLMRVWRDARPFFSSNTVNQKDIKL